LLGAIISVRYDDFIPALVGRRFESVIDVKKKRILHVGHEDSERTVLAASQGTSVEVRVIVKFLGGSENPGARGSSYNAEIV